MEKVAFGWLKRYPDSLAPLPPTYRKAFPGEPDINVNLRVYLANMYLHGASDVFDWPGDYRYARVQKLMAPLLEEKQYMSVEEIDARVWFASRCDNAARTYMAHLSKAFEEGELDEETLRAYVAVLEAQAKVNTARLYESVAIALEKALENPDEYRLLVGSRVPEFMIREHIQSVVRTASDYKRIAEEAKRQLAAELAGPRAKLIRKISEDLSHKDFNGDNGAVEKVPDER
jgi:hypothetical protein